MSSSNHTHKHLARAVPVGCSAALFFVRGDLEFVHVEGRRAVSKYVSIAAAQEAFGVGGIDSGWLPESVIRTGQGRRGRFMVAYLPPAERTIFVDDKKSRAAKLTLHLPGLVFMGVGTEYFVWAVSERAFSPKADCCHAPFPNVASSGRICYGSNKHPQVSEAGFAQALELLWISPFTSSQADGKSKARPKDVRTHLRAVAASKKPYPVSDLVKAGGSIESVVDRVISGDKEE